MNMTIREQIISVYNNRMPDQIPVSIYNKFLRSGEVERKARNMGLGIIDFVAVVSLMAPPWHLYPGYISEVRGASFDIKLIWENGKLIETRKYETPVGTISQQIIKDPTYGSDWINKHYIEKIEDYKIMQYIVENTIFERQENIIIQKIKDLGEDGVVLGRIDRLPYQKLLIELAGPERFLIDLHSDLDVLKELMEVMNDRLDEQFKLAIESKVGFIWQPDNITVDLTPPKAYKKYCLPFYQKYGKQCRKAGKVYLVHMDGRLNALKYLIAQSPFDVIDSFSFFEMSGDVSVTEAKNIWSDKVLCPNFPSSFCQKSKEEIKDFLEKVLNEFGKDTPFMIQISEDIPIDTYNYVLPLLTSFMRNKENGS